MSLLQTVNLKKYFGETRAVDDVTLSIEEGEFISLVGPNGAGKTRECARYDESDPAVVPH